ncbi:MAG: hypothetical protein HDT44_00355 [Ruminococcaceae bacterium]|nr:hypothetical protein [Oscillospiraceae bacterium]
MKKKDTVLYKIKVCTFSVLLCGLFTVFAVGCSNGGDEGDGDSSENSSDNSNVSIAIPEGSTIPKITFPDSTASGIPINRPDETRVTLGGNNRLTMAEISIVPFTRPDLSLPSETTSADDEDETVSFIGLPRETLNGDNSFDIVDDTTATEVYGFNG